MNPLTNSNNIFNSTSHQRNNDYLTANSSFSNSSKNANFNQTNIQHRILLKQSQNSEFANSNVNLNYNNNKLNGSSSIKPNNTNYFNSNLYP